MLSDIMTRTFLWGGRSRKSENNSGAITLLIGLVFLIISPIFAQLMKLSISRSREFLADATAIRFTRNPQGLISALQKLEEDTHTLKNANHSTAHMYIVNPFRKNTDNTKQKTSLWSTHPSTADRIAALENLK